MYRILIVDDEPHVCLRLKNQIPWEKLGIGAVASVTGPSAAHRFLEETHVHILLSDIRMPGESGIQLARAALDRDPEIRVVLMSAYDDKEYLKSAIQLHVAGFLEKPLNLSETERVLRETVLELQDRDRVNDYLRTTEIPASMDKDELVHSILEYLSAHMADSDLTLGSVSSAFFVSVPYLCALFKTHTGKSIKTYLNELRMHRASMLLSTSRMRVSEISAACGFSDQGYFSKWFTQHFGLSPRQYREEFRNDDEE